MLLWRVCPEPKSSAQVSNICTREQLQQHKRKEERFIIQASAFKTPCRYEAEAHHILHRHAETTHQPGLFLRSKGYIGTGWRYRWCLAHLSGLFLEEGDKVVAILGLLQATEGHLGTRNVLLGVLEVLELEKGSATTVCRSMERVTYEGVVTPVDTLALVGVGVGVTLDLTGLSAPETVKVGSSEIC